MTGMHIRTDYASRYVVCRSLDYVVAATRVVVRAMSGQPKTDGSGGRFAPVGGTEFAKDVRDVALDRA